MASNPRHYWSIGHTQETMQTLPLRPFPKLLSRPAKDQAQAFDITLANLEQHQRDIKSTVILETAARIGASQIHTEPQGADQPPPPPPPPPPTSNTTLIHASLRTRWQPYSSKPIALSETKFPPPHRSGPSATSINDSEDVTPGHLIDEGICKLEQYQRHAKPALERYYAVKKKVTEAAAVAAAAAARPVKLEPASAGAGTGLGTGKGKEKEEPLQKNELDISRDPRLRR